MKRPEEDLQRAVVQFLKVACPTALWFAVPNQRGTRKRWENEMLVAMGVRAGVPDLVFVLPGGRVGFIELKAPKGRMEASQLIFAEEALALGTLHLVCRSVAEVQGALAAWGLPLRGRVVE